ncbi:MAG: hypothetical protein ACYT04_89910, partial [Nostoc sp.]
MVNSTLDMKIITYAQCPILLYERLHFSTRGCTSLREAALLYETLRVACFHEVVRQGSVTTPTTTLLQPFSTRRYA